MNQDFPAIPDMTTPDHLRWRVEQLEGDEQLEGWIAGPCRRVMTHFQFGRTVPCCALMTASQVVCECESTPMAARVTGYLPVIRLNGDRVVLMLASTVAAQVQPWSHATPIRVTKSTRQKRPLKVDRLHHDSLSSTMRGVVSRAGEQDIRPYLLHLWQCKALCQHFGVEFIPSEATKARLAFDERQGNSE